jgi:hypothetical protein
MKGDKGKMSVCCQERRCTDELAEFSGTLVGFDDYVSEYFSS